MENIKELYIEVTNKCSQKCIHCSSMSCENSTLSLPIEKLKEIIRDTMSLGLKKVVVSGGEPFLYPHLLNLIDFIKKNNLQSTIYSCGVIGNSKDGFNSIEVGLFQKLKKYGLNHIIFSLHATNNDLQEKITKTKGSLNYVISSIKNAQKAGCKVELHTVPMSININYIDTIIEFAEKMHIEKLSVLRYVPQGRGTDSLTPSIEQYQKMIKVINEFSAKETDTCIRLGSPFQCITENKNKCSAGFGKLLISSNGEVFPCEAFKFMRGKQNNIYDSKILDIWENDELLCKVRNFTHDNSNCKGCSYSETCQGGCLGQTFLTLLNCENMRKGIDPLCQKKI